MKNPVKLLVFDLDGTALGGHEPYDQFPKPFVIFLDGLTERGICWATNTTWGLEGQLEVIRRSGVVSRPAFLGGATGRMLATVPRNSLKWDDAYAAHVAATDKRFRRENWPEIRTVMTMLLEMQLVKRLGFDVCGQNMLTYTAAGGCSHKVWELVEPLIRDDLFYAWNSRRRSENTLLPCHMNKGGMVRAMQKRLGIGPEQTIVAGDGCNDRHMFDPAIAKYMVCPANADDRIKPLVRRYGGVVARRKYSWGVIEGVERVLQQG